MFPQKRGNIFDALGSQFNRQQNRFGFPGGGPKTFNPNIPLSEQPGSEIEAARRTTARARQGEQDVQNAGRAGTLGSLVGGIAGTLIPVPILGPAIGSAVGGALGQMVGGVRPDLGDVFGYGASGALGGLAGGGVSQLAGQGAASGAGAILPYVGGQAALGGLARAFDLNTQYDPRYRYYYDTNTGQVESAFGSNRRFA